MVRLIGVAADCASAAVAAKPAIAQSAQVVKARRVNMADNLLLPIFDEPYVGLAAGDRNVV
jgi:hypothetical protein